MRLKIALMSDVIDRRPERTMVARRLAEYLLTQPDVELTLIHYERMPDDPLYTKAREILIPPISFPFRSRLLSFLWFAVTTKEKFDVVHWLVGRVYPFFWLLPTKATVVTTYDGGGVFAPGLWLFSRFVYNKVLQLFNWKVAAFIGASDYGSEQISAAYHVSRKKVHTIYLGIDREYRLRNKEEVEPILSRAGLSYKNYILYVGGMQTHKNVPALIRAYTLYRKSGRKEKLVLIGHPSYGAVALKDAMLACPYKEDIVYLSYTSDLPFFYNGARMYVHPSLNEGFGLTPVEAMASGTPVISSNATSLPEVTGGAALLIDPRRDEDIANAMVSLANDPALMEKLSEAGIERARRFTWENMGKEIFSLYQTLLRLV